MIKRVINILSCVLLICVLVSISVFAHPGNTDKNGGHHVTSTGEYHYHHGYPAHQHEGGVCQYDFDDKTGQNSGSTGPTRSSGSTMTNAQSSSFSISDFGKAALELIVFIGVASVLGIAVDGIANPKKKKSISIDETLPKSTNTNPVMPKNIEIQQSPVVDTKMCPLCGKRLVLRNGPYGQFYGCCGYPHCKYTRSVKSHS